MTKAKDYYAVVKLSGFKRHYAKFGDDGLYYECRTIRKCEHKHKTPVTAAKCQNANGPPNSSVAHFDDNGFYIIDEAELWNVYGI